MAGLRVTRDVDDELLVVGSSPVLGDGRRRERVVGDGHPADGGGAREGQPGGHRRHSGSATRVAAAVGRNFERATSSAGDPGRALLSQSLWPRLFRPSVHDLARSGPRLAGLTRSPPFFDSPCKSRRLSPSPDRFPNVQLSVSVPRRFRRATPAM